MAEPFSTNELFLRSDRIAFGKIPPDVPERTEQTLILPDVTGSKLFFGLSSLVSTSGITGTLEAIYPQYASFTFDNLNNRLGINTSTPQYAIDISSNTGIRILGGTLVANAQGLVSVPTASLFSTLPSYVFAPGSIPPFALASTGGGILPGISVATSALFSTLPTSIFAPSSIPLVALQSSGIIIASSFVGDGFYLSNIPLANINGTITGDFFRPNSIPLSTLASTGQIWIRNPEGSIFVPILSTGQLFTSSLTARNISTVNLTTNRFIASSIQSQYFESALFSASNLSAINIKASSIEVLCRISSGSFSGDGRDITSLTPAYLNNVIPSDKFGYRLISFDALNPYGNFLVIAGTTTFYQAVPVVVQGVITASTFQGGLFRGDGSGLYNLNSISTASLTSTVRGLGTAGYISTLSLTSSLQGLGSMNYVSTASLVSTTAGLSHSGYISSSQLTSTIEGLGTLGYVSSTQLASTVQGLATSGFVSSTQLTSTVFSLNTNITSTSLGKSAEITSSLIGLGTLGYISSTQLNSTLTGLATLGYVSSTQLLSTIEGLATSGYISSTQVNSTLTGLATLGYVSSTQLGSTVEGLATSGYISSTQLNSTLTGLATLGYVSSTQLGSTVEGLATSGYISSTQLNSTLTGLATLGYLSSTQLVSSLQGLGTLSYISSAQLLSSVAGLEFYISSFIDPNELASSITSTVVGLGLGDKFTSTVAGLGSAGYISSTQLISSVAGLEFYISSFIDPNELASTVTSTVVGLGLGDKFTSTVAGLGSAGYVSSLSLISTTLGLQEYISSFIDPNELASTVTSTVVGLGLGDKFTSTVAGLGSAGYVSSLSLISTTLGLQEYISSFIDPNELASTVTSTVFGLGIGDKFTSTVAGLGSAGYVSTLSMASSIQQAISSLSTAYGAVGSLATIPSTVSTFSLLTSSIQASTITVNYLSSLSIWVSSINGAPAGTLNSIPSTLSTFAILTSSINASTSITNIARSESTIASTLLVTGIATLYNEYLGNTSSLTTQQFYGLFGAYNNTVLAEISTGAGSQELLVFKGSSINDRVRVQTTGNFVVETGVSARLWSTNTSFTQSNATPAFIINSSSNVGIQTATPGATLDVAGSGRFVSISTQTLTVQSSLQVRGRYPSTFGLIVTPSSFVGLNTSTPLSQLYIKDISFPTVTPPIGIFDKDPTSVITTSQVYTGLYVLYTVPTSVTSITFNLWGAGGSGAGGAFVQATVPTTPGEQLRFIIGLAGTYTAYDATDAQGGAGSNGGGQNGAGGGRTAVQKFIAGQWVEVLTAGGGGGATQGFGGFSGGNAYWIGTSQNGSQGFSFSPAGGGSQIAGGAASGAGGTSGSFQKGGAQGGIGASGGGGYYGGGGAASGGGGGGASFSLSTLGGLPFVTNYSGSNGNYGTPIATTAFGYTSGVGVTGGNGLLALQYNGFRESDYMNFNRGGTTVFAVNSLGGLAVSKSGVTSNYALDVNGNILGTQATLAIVSTQALLVSTINGLPYSFPINSTVIGLGTSGYVSTLSMISSIQQAISSLSTAYGTVGGGGLASLPSTISTFSLLTSSIRASTISTIFLIASTITTNTINASTGSVSSFSTNTINFAGGFGYLTMPDIYPNTVFTSTVTTSNLLVGVNSVISPIQFYGFGAYANSVLSELSTGGTTQELLMFRGSNASDRIRFQTTGSVVFEPGVSARVWPTVPSNVTPAMVINTSSNVGIQIASPTVPLDVAGAIRAISFSTQQIATSSIINNPAIAGAIFTSSVRFLGPSTFLQGGFSTSFMTAGPQEVDFFTLGVQRMTILSNGNVGINIVNPTVTLDVAGITRLSTVFVSSLTAYDSLSTVLVQTSSLLGNVTSTLQMGASTFTGKWNDAQYYVLQTI